MSSNVHTSFFSTFFETLFHTYPFGIDIQDVGLRMAVKELLFIITKDSLYIHSTTEYHGDSLEKYCSQTQVVTPLNSDPPRHIQKLPLYNRLNEFTKYNGQDFYWVSCESVGTPIWVYISKQYFFLVDKLKNIYVPVKEFRADSMKILNVYDMMMKYYCNLHKDDTPIIIEGIVCTNGKSLPLFILVHDIISQQFYNLNYGKRVGILQSIFSKNNSLSDARFCVIDPNCPIRFVLKNITPACFPERLFKQLKFEGDYMKYHDNEVDYYGTGLTFTHNRTKIGQISDTLRKWIWTPYTTFCVRVQNDYNLNNIPPHAETVDIPVCIDDIRIERVRSAFRDSNQHDAKISYVQTDIGKIVIPVSIIHQFMKDILFPPHNIVIRAKLMLPENPIEMLHQTFDVQGTDLSKLRWSYEARVTDQLNSSSLDNFYAMIQNLVSLQTLKTTLINTRTVSNVNTNKNGTPNESNTMKVDFSKTNDTSYHIHYLPSDSILAWNHVLSRLDNGGRYANYIESIYQYMLPLYQQWFNNFSGHVMKNPSFELELSMSILSTEPDFSSKPIIFEYLEAQKNIKKWISIDSKTIDYSISKFDPTDPSVREYIGMNGSLRISKDFKTKDVVETLIKSRGNGRSDHVRFSFGNATDVPSAHYNTLTIQVENKRPIKVRLRSETPIPYKQVKLDPKNVHCRIKDRRSYIQPYLRIDVTNVEESSGTNNRGLPLIDTNHPITNRFEVEIEFVHETEVPPEWKSSLLTTESILKRAIIQMFEIVETIDRHKFEKECMLL